MLLSQKRRNLMSFNQHSKSNQRKLKDLVKVLKTQMQFKGHLTCTMKLLFVKRGCKLSVKNSLNPIFIKRFRSLQKIWS